MIFDVFCETLLILTKPGFYLLSKIFKSDLLNTEISPKNSCLYFICLIVYDFCNKKNRLTHNLWS